jgi:hypothetical protein
MDLKSVHEALSLITGVVFLAFMAGLGALILYGVLKRQIDLTKLISEPDGKASMSRLQLLVFTFVISLSLFFIVVGSGKWEFPAISSEILMLLGISSSTTLVSKAISGGTTPSDKSPSPPAQAPTAAAAAAAAGAATGVSATETDRKP